MPFLRRRHRQRLLVDGRQRRRQVPSTTQNPNVLVSFPPFLRLSLSLSLESHFGMFFLTHRVPNLGERILEDLNVDNGAVLAKVLAQLVGRRLPAETAHQELVVGQVGRRRATGRAALIQGQSAHSDFRLQSAATGRTVAIAIHARSASTSVVVAPMSPA